MARLFSVPHRSGTLFSFNEPCTTRRKKTNERKTEGCGGNRGKGFVGATEGPCSADDDSLPAPRKPPRPWDFVALFVFLLALESASYRFCLTLGLLLSMLYREFEVCGIKLWKSSCACEMEFWSCKH